MGIKGRSIAGLELQQILGEPDYPRFQGEVERLIESGVLVPVKAAKKNGRIPPLYTLLEEEDQLTFATEM